MSNTNYVTTGKPKIGGAVYRAVIGTTLPTNATTELSEDFISLGYISEDGLTNENTKETDSIKAWGGETVFVTPTAHEDTFGMTFIEVLNIEVLKTIYGSKNVKGTLDTGITINVNGNDIESYVYVIDMVCRGNVLKRVVIPNGAISEVGEISYTDSDAVGYETTITAITDNEGNTHYEYISKASEDTE